MLELIRTVVAVTEPLLADGPKALTQSPTARSVAAAAWVALTVVEPDVVMVNVSVLGALGLLGFELEPERERNESPESAIPEMVSVEPLTAVTLPDAMSSDAKVLRKLFAPEPEGNEGRVPPGPPPSPRAKPPPPGLPGKAPGGLPSPPERAPPLAVQDPPEEAVVTVRLRAATVVFELFDALPVAVTQSPTTTEDTDSVTVLENCVVPVHETVV